MRNRRLIFTALVLLAVGLFFMWPKSKYLTCQVSYRNDKEIRIGSHILKTQIAKTQQELAQGLGGRTCIGSDRAMLFEFPSTGYYPFWAKDMRFAIDIVWVSSSKKVAQVQPNVPPSSYPQTFSSAAPVKYVLEVGAGEASKDGLVPGAQLNF